MKKLFAIFLAVAMLSFSNTSTVLALDIHKLIESSENVRKEYVKNKDIVDFRDFDFLLGMTFVQMSAWNTEMGKSIPDQRKVTISNQYCAILSAQYISMQQYVNRYVIGKSKNKNETMKKCAKLLEYLEQGLAALR